MQCLVQKRIIRHTHPRVHTPQSCASTISVTTENFKTLHTKCFVCLTSSWFRSLCERYRPKLEACLHGGALVWNFQPFRLPIMVRALLQPGRLCVDQALCDSVLVSLFRAGGTEGQ